MSVLSGSSPCVSRNISNMSLPGLPTTNGSLCAGILIAATILPVPEENIQCERRKHFKARENYFFRFSPPPAPAHNPPKLFSIWVGKE